MNDTFKVLVLVCTKRIFKLVYKHIYAGSCLQKKVIVQNLTLGNTPPRITMIRILDTPVDGDDLVCLSSQLLLQLICVSRATTPVIPR